MDQQEQPLPKPRLRAVPLSSSRNGDYLMQTNRAQSLSCQKPLASLVCRLTGLSSLAFGVRVNGFATGTGRKCPTMNTLPTPRADGLGSGEQPLEGREPGGVMPVSDPPSSAPVDPGEPGDFVHGGRCLESSDEVGETVHTDDHGAELPHLQGDSAAELPRPADLHSGVTSDARRALAEFLQRDQAAWKASGQAMSEREWCEKHGFDEPSEIRRARHGQLNLGIDKLSRYAEKLGVEPWQLIFPDFDRNSPAFPTMSDEAVRVAHAVDRISDPAKRAKAEASIVGLLRLLDETDAAQASGTTSPAEPPPPAPDTMRGPLRRR
jgi:hypothetical protein